MHRFWRSSNLDRLIERINWIKELAFTRRQTARKCDSSSLSQQGFEGCVREDENGVRAFKCVQLWSVRLVFGVDSNTQNELL